MFAVRRLFFLLLIIFSLVLLVACQDDSSSSAGSRSRSISKNFQWQPLYGDGANDVSGVIARVGDIEITARDLELYYDELPSSQEINFLGPEGKRLLLKLMIDHVIMVQGAVEKKLFNDPDVARTIIANRRNTLISAMRNYGLLRARKPTEEMVREHFMNNRTKYRQLGTVNARHIECKTEKAADEAYRRLVEGGYGNDWMSVMVEMTVNKETKDLDGSVGWFNKDGMIPFITGSKEFNRKIFDLDLGVHPPFKVVNRWHVVEILKRDNERPMTFSEAKNQVEIDMMPAWQDAILKDYMVESRKQIKVEMLGDFAPGKGLSADELFARALGAGDPERKIELLYLIYTDYPESDRADDALFLAANVALEFWSDGRVAEWYLRRLLEEYPDSELAEDSQFLKDNLYNPEVLNPKSMEGFSE